MSTINLEELGITTDDLTERIVQRIADNILIDDNELEYSINKMLTEKVNEAVVGLGDAEIGPRIAEMVEAVTLHATNQWGEKRGEPLTFKEYLVERAEKYMTDEVDFEGKPKGPDSYNWRPCQTRITHMVHKHLHYAIESAMEEALKSANSQIAQGITDAVKLKLDELLKGIKATVTVKS